jgi:transcriptional regulator with XRE-family HTH domain
MTNPSEIGSRIHLRRTEMGITIRELARRTDLSASFISQVERGKVNVSIDSLQRIASNLEVSILYFLPSSNSAGSPNLYPKAANTPEDSASLEYNPVVRKESRPRLTLPASGITYELLVNALTRKMEAIHETLEPGASKETRPLRQPTEEFIYVTSGILKVDLDIGEYELNPGDSIYFEGKQLQRLSCVSEIQNAVWISVITPPVL